MATAVFSVVVMLATVAIPAAVTPAAAQQGECIPGTEWRNGACVADFTTVESCPAGFSTAPNPNDGSCSVANAAAFAQDAGSAYCNGLVATHPGTSGPDVITGSPGDDVILGFGGDDLIVGGGGDDIICGGTGDDQIWGQAGDDMVFGNSGGDRLRGGDDNDVLRGGTGQDDLNGGRGNDAVSGDRGNDPVTRGGTGVDWVSGGDGNDAIVSGNGGEDSVHGGPGDDKVIGGPRKDVVRGGPDDDEVKGNKGADRLSGDEGNDKVLGGAQNDTLDGGPGTDDCNGGTGDNDTATNCESEIWIEFGTTAPPAPTVAIGGVAPVQIVLPDADGEPRPLAAVAGPDGEAATFVENELIVMTDDTDELAAILAAYDGQVLREIATEGLDLPTIYLIRVGTDGTDPAALPALMGALADLTGTEATGEHQFSSNAGAALMAMAGTEALGGAMVGINWVGAPDDIPDESIEGPARNPAYVRNAYNWNFLNSGSTQDIGVVDAWNALDASGRYGNRVQYAILDKGFAPNEDFPARTQHINTLFGIPPQGIPGDAASPWHGNHVMQTAMAVPDNGYGIAGVAHTVAEPINIYTGYDFITSIAAVIAAGVAGAEIINMSYSANVPAGVSFTVLPFEAATAILRASGVLLFASAGNDGEDVDAERCFFVCWERTWHTPCENAGVICVGGLAWDSKNRDPGSNFGSAGSGDTVDIYAPYWYFKGAEPGDESGVVDERIAGTSFASPFAGAVAALIWAADPSLNAGQVEAQLNAFAHPSPDPQVNRYVNARDAVLDIIGNASSVEITAPVDGGSQSLGRSWRFSADVGVVSRGASSAVVTWTSNRDGEFGRTTHGVVAGANAIDDNADATLSPGAHAVTVRVAFGGTSVSDTINVTITNTAPTASIDQPASGASVCAGRVVNLRGSAFDPEEFSPLPDASFTWTSSRDGGLGAGRSLPTSGLSTGGHTITLTVVDSGGIADSDTINLTVLAASDPACVGSPPEVTIVAPANDASIYADTIDFRVTVADDRTPAAELIYEWTSDVDGAVVPVASSLLPPLCLPLVGGAVVCTDAEHRATLDLTNGTCGRRHIVTIRVRDADGNVGTDSIIVTASQLC